MFHEGTAVLKGRFTGYAGGERSAVVELIHYNHFFNDIFEPSVEAIPVESDGTFYAELQLAHSQYVFSSTLRTNIFLIVGDTLNVEFDLSKYDENLRRMPQPQAYRFSGNVTPVQVNTHWKLLEQKHFANKPSWRAMLDKGQEGMREMMRYYEGRLDTLSQLIAEDRLELPAGLTPQACEVLQYGLLSNAYKQELDIRFKYMTSEMDSTKTEKEVLQSEAFTRIFSKYEDAVLNTPMILLNPDTWVLFNRLFVYQYRYVFRRLEQEKGLHRTFTTDLALAAHAQNLLNEAEEDGKVSAYEIDWLLNSLTHILDEVRHPLVRHRLKQIYHDFVLGYEAAQKTDEAQIMGSTLLKLIEPYKGMMLCIDFLLEMLKLPTGF